MARCSNIRVRSLHWRHVTLAPCSAVRAGRTLSCMRVYQLCEVHDVSLFSTLCLKYPQCSYNNVNDRRAPNPGSRELESPRARQGLSPGLWLEAPPCPRRLTGALRARRYPRTRHRDAPEGAFRRRNAERGVLRGSRLPLCFPKHQKNLRAKKALRRLSGHHPGRMTSGTVLKNENKVRPFPASPPRRAPRSAPL